MVIALLFVSLMGGLMGGGLSAFLGFGWGMIVGTYMLGGMIGSGIVISVAISKDARPDTHKHSRRKSVRHVTG